jgi:hypothetical protein
MARWSDGELRSAQAVLSARWLRPGVAGTRGVRRAAVWSAGVVHGVGIGRKWVGGRPTQERCVRIHVLRKLARRDVPLREMLPASIDGIATDVVVAPLARASVRERRPLAPAAPPCSRERRSARRPLVAGVSVAHHAVSAGTIAAFVRSTRRGDDAEVVHLLSNHHVLAGGVRPAAGDDVLQPGPYDGGTDEHHVADLHRFVPVRIGGRAANRVDAAMARLRRGVGWRPQICSIGRVRGQGLAEDGLFVKKHGRTTGLTEGVVTDVAYDALVAMDEADGEVEARFTDQVRLASRGDSPVGLGGDSGSLVVTLESAPRAIGLYFAGSEDGSYGVANPIDAVLERLEVEILP